MGMEHIDGTPHPALAGIALRYAGFSQRADGPVRFRPLPCTFVPLILDLGEGWRVGDGRAPGAPLERLGPFVAGLTDGPVVVEHPGSARCLQVDLTPLGARRLLGVPMHELANRSVPLDAVLGRRADDLIGRLSDCLDWEGRFAIIDRVIAARLASGPPPPPEIAWALGRIECSGGRVVIGDLARELGWSHRRLIARFRDQVGLAPKSVARIVRFERTMEAIAAEPEAGLARVAAACGFADQAHLAREVGDLAARTPTQLRDEAVNSVQDPVAASA